MREVTGDLIALATEGRFDVIVHGCNCFCTMGAGIAKSIKAMFPEAFAADLETPAGDRDKLGHYSCARVKRGAANFTIVNAYTQFDWRGRDVRADYDAIRAVFRRIKADFPDSRIGYPLIGAGLAKGDWGIISRIIVEELADMNHCLVLLQPTMPPRSQHS